MQFKDKLTCLESIAYNNLYIKNLPLYILANELR